ncbi:uncharacterized protein LOC134837375 [Culicoides brevitarsis]|uniref:uncharacterized protein LOC134837375 n=1 Tax=Culicoides brevitarsis TaxID=469753 RepID=UPI00307C219C
MSHQLPITTAPKRRPMDNPAIAAQMLMNLNTSESCKNTPAVARKLDAHHRALLESGSQSAANSPLPQRRLDKLQGIICDKATPLAIRKRLELEGDVEPSPIVSRKYLNYNVVDNAYAAGPRNSLGSATIRRNTDCEGSPMSMRRRVDSDCTCAKKFAECGSNHKQISTLRRQKTDFYGSPVKSVLGEPGVFSSPMHKPNAMTASFGSPAKSMMGEPGVFASPAHSVSSHAYNEKIAGEGDDEDSMLLQDQTIVSGWLKFRDNKKWKIRWGVVTKLSPAAGKSKFY